MDTCQDIIKAESYESSLVKSYFILSASEPSFLFRRCLISEFGQQGDYFFAVMHKIES